jgi:hypothetical protein
MIEGIDTLCAILQRITPLKNSFSTQSFCRAADCLAFAGFGG